MKIFDESKEKMSCGHLGKWWFTELKVCLKCVKIRGEVNSLLKE